MRIDFRSPRTSYGPPAAIGAALALALCIMGTQPLKASAAQPRGANTLSPKWVKAEKTAVTAQKEAELDDREQNKERRDQRELRIACPLSDRPRRLRAIAIMGGTPRWPARTPESLALCRISPGGCGQSRSWAAHRDGQRELRNRLPSVGSAQAVAGNRDHGRHTEMAGDARRTSFSTRISSDVPIRSAPSDVPSIPSSSPLRSGMKADACSRPRP